MDAAGVDMLLHCMAEIMKRDGELKLAAVSPQAAVVLELTRTDRLFEVFETSGAAVSQLLSLPAQHYEETQPVLIPRWAHPATGAHDFRQRTNWQRNYGLIHLLARSLEP